MSDAELLIEEIKTLPAGRVAEVLDGEGCPICAKHRDPQTGEPRYNAETIAGMQEVEDMITGKIPVKWHTSIEDLDKMLGL